MFHQARIKLTVVYSLIFLFLFWFLSLGIYLWMNHYFGDHGIDRNIHINNEALVRSDNRFSKEPPSDIIMDELRNVLFLLDISLLIFVPGITWFLTGRTLMPIQKAHARERQFLTDASHDLRTPLTILSGELELALEKKQTNDEYRHTLQSNKEEVDNLIGLVENMLFFARSDRQNQPMVKEQVDLTDLLTERVATFQILAKQKNQHLSLSLPTQSIVISGYPLLINRLLTNLLDNAIKYTPKRGNITVKLSQDTSSIHLTIMDSGIGIATDQQEKVFDRFYKVDSSRTHKGYGLGLAIVKEIVTLHNGKITLSSKPDHGTSITVIFPSLK